MYFLAILTVEILAVKDVWIWQSDVWKLRDSKVMVRAMDSFACKIPAANDNLECHVLRSMENYGIKMSMSEFDGF